MADEEVGLTRLERKIEEFELKIEEMKTATQEANSLLKQIRIERREIEKIMSADVKAMVVSAVEECVKKELDEIGPEIRNQTSLIYERVGEQIDKVINLSLGKEFSTKLNKEDLRPLLAAKFREWIQEIISQEGL